MTEQHAETADRAKFELSKKTEPERAHSLLTNYLKCKADPWYFLTTCVFTQDQVDRENPIKPYPADLEYLHLFVMYWQRYNQIAVSKSRRMIMSWTCIPLYLWDTIFHPGRFNAFVSKKEDDAADLIGRAEFIYHHIPETSIPHALLPKINNSKMSKQPPLLGFDSIHSKIQGFPMGAHQMRQYTLSGILGDECAFWEDAQKFYANSKPTTDGGGRMTLISSRSPGFFKKLIFDQIDSDDLNFPEIPPAPVKHPMPGIEIWQNPKNQFIVYDIHYTANPEKRSLEWREAIRSALPKREFEMEYERNWNTFAGLPVFGDFSKQSHVSEFSLTPHLGIPLLLGWDFGLTPACIVAQLVEGQLRIIREYIGTNIGIVKFSEAVWQDFRLKYTAWTHSRESLVSFIDPAGLAKNQVDERTCAEALRKQGFQRIEPGPIDFESRREAVEYFLIRQGKNGSALLLDPKECPTLIEGFAGGYRYSEKELDKQSTKLMPIKDRYSHPHDALQYLAAGAIGKLKQYHITSTPPQYAFQKRKESK